jgi:hypothetical protein
MYLRMKLTLTRSFKSGELEDGIWQFFTGKIALSWGKLHFFQVIDHLAAQSKRLSGKSSKKVSCSNL